MLCKKISVFLFKVYSLIFLSIIFSSCSNIDSKTERLDTDVLKYPPREYEMRKRMKEEGRETFISNLFSGERKKKNNAQKQNLNVNPYLWKASLDVLSSAMPLISIDSMSGIIISDWYNLKGKSNERVKITILIQSSELRSDGLKVEIFKQINKANSWQSAKIDPSIALALERKIIQKAGFLSSQVD